MTGSWIQYDADNHFSLENIPFGCFKAADGATHCCTRIGDSIIDLSMIFDKFDGPHFSTLKENIFANDTLNKFADLGKEFRQEARATIQKLFTDKANEAALAGAVSPAASA